MLKLRNYRINCDLCRTFFTCELLQGRQKSHYDALGLTAKATQSDIKAAYYKLSMQFHPDKNQDSSEALEKFKEITAAYEILGNYKSRKMYDRGLIVGSDGTGFHPAAPGSAAHARHSAEQPDDDKEARFHKHRMRSQMSPTNFGSGRSPIYNFDEWAKAHYSENVQRNHRVKQKKEEMERYEEYCRVTSRQDFLLFGSLFLAFLVIYALMQESGKDRVRHIPPSPPPIRRAD